MFEGLLQPMHLLLILGIALVVFGPKRLPEIGRGLGEGIRSFKDSFREAQAPAVTPRLREREEPPPGDASAPRVDPESSHAAAGSAKTS